MTLIMLSDESNEGSTQTTTCAKYIKARTELLTLEWQNGLVVRSRLIIGPMLSIFIRNG